MLGWGRWVGKLGSLLSLELNALAQPAGKREKWDRSLRGQPLILAICPEGVSSLFFTSFLLLLTLS